MVLRNMQCLVINLDRSIDRMKHIEEQFNGFKGTLTRVEGCDAAAYKADELFSFVDDGNSYRDMIPAEIACFLSHRKCWNIAANSENEFTAIFEDDIFLSSNAIALLENVSWLPADAGCVKLETLHQKVTVSRRKKILPYGYKMHKLLSAHYGAGGYIISKKFAAEAFEKSMLVPCISDEYLFGVEFLSQNRNHIYQVSPAVCIQARLLSDKNNFETLIADYTEWNNSLKTSKIKKTIPQKIYREAVRFKDNVVNIHSIVNNFATQKKIVIDFK